MTDSPTPPLLRATGLWKSFGDREVLRGIDLDLAQHDVVALIGPSGSGKSTLLRCLGLLEPIDDGQIFLGDEDISDPRVDANGIRARFGAVFQSFNLFPHLSVLDNVTLASRVVHRMPRREAEERAHALLGRIGLADKAKEHPDRLSGGSSSAPRSSAPSPPTPRCCCSTRSPRRSTPSSSAKYSNWSATSPPMGRRS